MIKIFFIFEKSKLKKQELNLNFFNTLEQAKIKEWFAYKSMKKHLNIPFKTTHFKAA